MTGSFPMRTPFPLAAQIIALLIGVLVLGQAATLAVVTVLPPPRAQAYRLEEVAAALQGERTPPRYSAPLEVRIATSAPDDGDDRRAAALGRDLARILEVPAERVRVRLETPPLLAFPFSARGPRVDRRWSGSNALSGGQAALPPPGERQGLIFGRFTAGLEVGPGRWAVVSSPGEPFPNLWQQRMIIWLAVCLAALALIGWVFARRITAPLRRFALAAEHLGRDPRAPPAELAGPAEVGVAARALNEMQSRLNRYVEDRTAMMAAIAHDLRTPLARVEFKLQRAPEDVADDIRSDLRQMAGMISAVLGFVRDLEPAGARQRVDLLSLLEVVTDDAGADGSDVALDADETAVVLADRLALQRLFTNLVDNALKYGGAARVTLARAGCEAVVSVQDPGPGIPSDKLETVFEPFTRLEGSRSRETGGIGLGLSVARSIARSHGGDVELLNAPGGFIARVRLPCEAPAGARRREARPREVEVTLS